MILGDGLDIGVHDRQIVLRDSVTLLGAFIDLADRLRGADETDPRHLAARWRRRGLRAFDADRDDAAVKERPTGQEEGAAQA